MRGGGHSANDAPQAHVLSGFTLESSRTIIAEVLRERARLCDATLFHVTWLTQSALAASLTLPFDCAADLVAAAQTLRLYSGWLRGSLPRCFADDPVGARNTLREAITQLALLFRRRHVAVGEAEGEGVDERAAMALGRAHERLCRRALDMIDEASRDPLGPVGANAEHVLRTLLHLQDLAAPQRGRQRHDEAPASRDADAAHGVAAPDRHARRSGARRLDVDPPDSLPPQVAPPSPRRHRVEQVSFLYLPLHFTRIMLTV